jgi:ribonuclease Y
MLLAAPVRGQARITENYIQRLETLENIANSFKGVEKSFAIQAVVRSGYCETRRD